MFFHVILLNHVIQKGKNKNGDANVPVHIKKSHIQLAQIIRLYKQMLIQQERKSNCYSRQVKGRQLKDGRETQEQPYGY